MTCLLTGLAIGQVAWAHDAIDPPRIQRILICGNERTTAEIIRRELLFAKGDLVDSSRIAETERDTASRWGPRDRPIEPVVIERLHLVPAQPQAHSAAARTDSLTALRAR